MTGQYSNLKPSSDERMLDLNVTLMLEPVEVSTSPSQDEPQHFLIIKDEELDPESYCSRMKIVKTYKIFIYLWQAWLVTLIVQK